MNVLESFDLFLLDMDGVIYTGSHPVPGSVEAINHLYSKNKKIIFLTNNPSGSNTEYKRKLKNIGIKADVNQIVTSATSLCHYLTGRLRNINTRSAYVIGSKHLKNSVARTGVKLISTAADSTNYVIMGGHKNFNYSEIEHASRFIRNGARLIATNRDPYYPSKDGFSPGTGALLSSIEISGGKKALITGKPEKHIFHLSLKLAGVRKNRAVIIGDSLKTDILGGINYGIYTVLTLSGVTDKKELQKSRIKPDKVIRMLSSLID